jgi:hypothetical protein
MSGVLGNENIQKALREIDRRMRAEEIADLKVVLSTPAGRRVYCRIVYGVCALEGISWNPNVKDGACKAQIDSFDTGQKSIGRLLAEEALMHWPDLWGDAQVERIRKATSDQAQREVTLSRSAKEEAHD